MLLPIEKIKHVNSINHEGKIVIVVTDKDGELFYTIRQEGHEDNYDKTILKGWEDWSVVPIPDQESDASVLQVEAKEWSDNQSEQVRPIIRSIYQTKNTTAVAPVQLISGIGHLYVFRQQRSGKLAVDRFVLDGMTNKLVPKLQVRFKRSRQRFEPLRKDANGNEVMDSVDFRDANNLPFLEPSTELSILPATDDGWFSVVLLPTKEADRFRWHIFICNKHTRQLELWSIASSENGLFDINDRGEHPGLLKRVFKPGNNINIAQGPVATKFDVQFERMTEAGPQLLRDKIRVMLVVPTSNNNMALAINFSVNQDGFLSEISEPVSSEILRKFSRQVLLPINSLDDIKAIGQDKATGTIEALHKGEDDEVWLETDPESLPKMGDEVEVSGTNGFNGLHKVLRATKNTLTIEGVPNKAGDDELKLGKWEEILDPNESLLFDGMVTQYRKMAGNTIRITSPQHGLKKGDQLQLIGSEDIDGTFEVQDIRKDSFSINMKWNNSQLVNIQLQAKRRRGIYFDAVGDAVKTPILPLSNPTIDNSFERTVAAWVCPEDLNEGTQLIAGNDKGLLQLLMIDGHVTASFRMAQAERIENEQLLLADSQKNIVSEWTHFAASFAYDHASNETKLYLLRDGEQVAERTINGKPKADVKSAIVYDGHYDNILVAEKANFFNFNESDFTLECWVKTKESGAVFLKHSIESNEEKKEFINLIIDESGRVVFMIEKDLGIHSDKPVNDDEWHHLAIVYNQKQKNISLYIDGLYECEADLREKVISGTVTDKDGQALSGVTVSVKGTTTETLTDVNGNYSISTSFKEIEVLVFRHPRLAAKEVKVGSSSTIDISLWPIYGSQYTAYGTIKDENGLPLSEAAVIIKGTNQGRPTDLDGRFSLAASPGAIVEISYPGLLKQEVIVREGIPINITLRKYADVKVHNRITEEMPAFVTGTPPDRIIIANGGNSTSFKGSIDEVRIWKRAKSVQEIQAQKDVRLLGSEASLLACWSFENPHPVDQSDTPKMENGGYAYKNKTLYANDLMTRKSLPAENGPAYKTGKWKEAYWLGGMEEAKEGVRPFNGKLSNVQIWDKALAVNVVKDAMYMDLRGTEDGLSVYYPMGGIMDGTVIDFSVHRLHGIVYGDPFYSERAIERFVLGDKPAEMFRNDNLIAVSQGAKYVESFEFRLKDKNGKVVFSDDEQPFQFYVWGKLSHTSDKQVEIETASEQIVDLKDGNGWHRAICTFFTPDTVRLVRVFGLKELDGGTIDWSSMEVRKHKLTFHSDAATLLHVEDHLENVLPIEASFRDPGELYKLENKERLLLREIKKLKRDISKVGDGDFDSDLLDEKKKELEDKQSELKKLENNPLSYYCTIYFQRENTDQKYYLTFPENIDLSNLKSNASSLILRREDEISGIGRESAKWKNRLWWGFEDLTDSSNYNSLDSIYHTHKYYAGDEHFQKGYASIVLFKDRLEKRHQSDAKKYETGLKDWKVSSSKVFTQIFNEDSGEYLGVNIASKEQSPVGIFSSDDLADRLSSSLYWTIEIDASKELSYFAKGKKKTIDKNIHELENEIAALGNGVDLRKKLEKVEGQLKEIQIQINEFASASSSSNNESASSEQMPLLTSGQLPTRAAYLSFVKAASRLNIMESCEGNLILSFFDLNGVMRQALFDATSDSRNSYFEQWKPDAITNCLDFSKYDNSHVSLNTPYELGQHWTLEFWFTYPLNYDNLSVNNQNNLGMVFLGGTPSSELGVNSPAMVLRKRQPSDQLHLEKEELGVYYGEKMEWLDKAVKELEDQLAIQQAELNDYKTQIGNSIDRDDYDAFKEEVDKLEKELIRLRDLDAYFAGSGFDMQQLTYGWHHMTVQGVGADDAGTVTFYVDGLKVGADVRSNLTNAFDHIQTEDFKKFNFNYSGKLKTIGAFPGSVATVNLSKPTDIGRVDKLTEIRFWDIALSPEEIEMNSRSYLSGNEPGLKVHYPLKEGTGNLIRNNASHYSLDTDLNLQMTSTEWMPSSAPIGHPGDSAIYFNGEEDFIGFDKPVKLAENFTIAFWFKASNEKKPFGLGETIVFTLFKFQQPVVDENPSVQFLAFVWESVLVLQLKKDGIEEVIAYNLGTAVDGVWHHFSLSVRHGEVIFVYDGEEVFLNNSDKRGRIDQWTSVEMPLTLGNEFMGQLADFKIWDRSLSNSEVQQMRFRRFTGSEPNLSLYCPLEAIAYSEENEARGKVLNFVSENHGYVQRSISRQMEAVFTNDLPIGLDAVVVNEYPTVAFDPDLNKQTAMMWRCLSIPKIDKLHLLSQKRVELLEYVWIGNGQFDPTLLGFIEGAPPVPSENLTLEDDYSDATSVALSVGNNTEYTWERTQDVFTELDLSAKFGAGATVAYGGGVGAIALTEVDFKVLAALSANFRYGAQNSTNIFSSSSLNLNDSISLRGYKEEEASIKNVGKRFLPKNVGYALVVSSMADIFIVRLKRSKKMVSYKVLPLEGVPPEINTITFMINPAYSMNGSLDGQVGTTAADKRFYEHVPEMRSQFGSKYPASYLKLDEALELKHMIDSMDKEREAYYVNFNSRLVDETALANELAKESPGRKSNYRKRGEPSKDDADRIEEDSDDFEAEVEEVSENNEKEIDKYQTLAETNAKVAGKFAWQTKMEKLLIKAGKQNIVNSYVWDADGGLHISNESFANAITHSIGGSFSFVGSLGMEWEITAGFAGEMAVAAGVGVEITMSKSKTESKEVSLEVDLSGMEHRGITDHKDRPLLPGEKVDRYRFSSFFLEGSTDHFHDFFNQVVDPEWLASNDEEARALRSVNVSKPNKTWRILHRVTYVERPALMGFGKDARPLMNVDNNKGSDDRLERIDDTVRDVERNTEQLKRKVNLLEEALEQAHAQNHAVAEKLEQLLSLFKKDSEGE